MNQDEASRNQWSEALPDSERAIWLAKARSAGVDAWQLKKASIFDRGVKFAELQRQLDQNGDAQAAPSN